MTRDELKVGTTVFMKTGVRWKNDCTAVVVKISKKYATVAEIYKDGTQSTHEDKIDLERMAIVDKTTGNALYSVWVDQSEYEAFQLLKNVWRSFTTRIDDWNPPNDMTLEKIEQLKNIMGMQ